MTAPTREPPILVEYLQYEDQYTYQDLGTPAERKPLRPGDVWINYDNIPATPPVPSPYPGTVGPFTMGVLDEPLTQEMGNPYRFATTPANRLMLMIPGNLLGGVYRPSLKDATGREIPYDPSVWVADGLEEVLQFKFQTPAELGYSLPLSLTYWVYTGAVAGTSVGIAGLANEGAGTGQVFDTVMAGTAFLRTLQADPAAGSEGLAISTPALPGDVIRIGNTLTGSNLGVGTGTLFSAKSGSSLQFNSLAGTANGLTVSAPAAGTIAIDNTLTGANLGAGTGTLFSAKSGASLQFNSLAGTANGLAVSAPAAGVVTIDNTLTGANLGVGAQVFEGKTGAALRFRSLVTGVSSGLTATQGASDITLNAAAGSVVSLANEGAGPGQVFDSVVGTTAQLRTLQVDPAAGSGGLAITTPALPGNEVRIGNTLTGANLGAGTGTLFSAKSGAALQFNSLAGTANGLAVSAPAAGVVTIDNTLTGANLGAGAQVFEGKTGANLRFRSLVAGVGSGLTATQGASDITLSAAVGSVVSLANEGAGTGLVFDSVVGTAAQLRTLQADPAAGSGGLAITTPVVPGNEIRIGNTLTGANLGAGTGTLFSAKSGATLQFNSLAGTANGLAVSAPVANVVTIDNTLTGANVGAGTGTLFSAKSGAALQFNSLAGTANGLAVSAPAAGVVTIDNTLTGANLGAGAQVFEGKTGANLRFRSLAVGAGSGLTATQGASDITLNAAAGSVVSLANEGAGTGLVFDSVIGTAAQLRTLQADPAAGSGGLAITTPVVPGNEIRIGNTLTGANLGAGTGTLFSAKSGAALQFNSLAGTANGLAVSAPAAGVVTIDNTLTGANVGAGTGTLFSAKSAASLQFNSLAGTANGLVVSAPAAGVVTIDNTLTGANLGAGAQVFEGKVGATLRHRSIVAGANMTVTQNASDITLASSAGAGMADLTIWHFMDQKSTGTQGGASIAGVQTRTLNTTFTAGPSPGNATLLANVITLQPGRYFVRGSAPCLDGAGHRTRLVRDLTGTTELFGQSAVSKSGVVTSSTFSGMLAPGIVTGYRIVHFISAAVALNGLGSAVSDPGQQEVYAEVTIMQIG